MKNKREQILRALVNDRKSLIRKDIINLIYSRIAIFVICVVCFKLVFNSGTLEQEQFVHLLYVLPVQFYYLLRFLSLEKEIQFELDENKYDIVSNIKTLRNKEMYFT